MEQFFSPDATKKILLTASDSRLYAHHFQNERYLRSTLLCSNYECGLSYTLYNGTLYYTYINREHSLLLRCIGESSLTFRLDGTEANAYRAPRLVVFDGFLLLLYFEYTGGAYQLRIRAPFADLPPITLPSFLPASFDELPDLGVLSSEKYIYLLLSAGASPFMFRYTTSFESEVLCSEEEFLTPFRISWETEKTALEQRLRHVVQQSELQQTILAEKETILHTQETVLAEKDTDLQAAEALLTEKTSELSATKARLQQSEETLYRVRNQLAECETARREALQKLTQTAGLLERAKVQYEELMQVALQYKEEAAKWYGKFTDRH